MSHFPFFHCFKLNFLKKYTAPLPRRPRPNTLLSFLNCLHMAIFDLLFRFSLQSPTCAILFTELHKYVCDLIVVVVQLLSSNFVSCYCSIIDRSCNIFPVSFCFDFLKLSVLQPYISQSSVADHLFQSVCPWFQSDCRLFQSACSLFQSACPLFQSVPRFNLLVDCFSLLVPCFSLIVACSSLLVPCFSLLVSCFNQASMLTSSFPQSTRRHR